MAQCSMVGCLREAVPGLVVSGKLVTVDYDLTPPREVAGSSVAVTATLCQHCYDRVVPPQRVTFSMESKKS